MNRLLPVLFTAALAAVTAPAQQPDLNQAYAAAQATLASGDLDGARRQFAALSRSHPQVAELHATLGALLFQQGDFPSALRELDAAKKLKPSLPNLDGLIAMSNAELGHYDVALAPLESTFRNAAEAPVKRQSGLELERAYTALHEDAKAVAVALELQQLFPQDPEVLYHNERIFGNFAYLTVQALTKVAPESVWRYQAQAEALESQGSHDAALIAYRKVLALDPNHPGTHYRIGRVLRERARDSHHPEDLDAARQEFAAELKLNPDNASAAYEIGELDRLAGHLEEARSSFEAALRTYPDFPEANLGLGTVLTSLNQPAAALPYLKKATESDPTDEATWYRLSLAERALGHKPEAAAALQHFLDLRKSGSATPAPTPEHDNSRQAIDPNTQP